MLILDELELYQNWLENELRYEVQQVSLDEYKFYIEGSLYAKYINCSKVSEAFLKECIVSDIAFILDDGYDETNSFMTIDVEELLDEWIREGLWDWKKEVKERVVGHGEIVFNMEELREEGRKKRYE